MRKAEFIKKGEKSALLVPGLRVFELNTPVRCAELEAMYSLRKYRALKQRYYDEPPPPPPTSNAG